MSTTKKARGRGFLHFKSITERAAFGAYMKDVYEAHGGRNAVADLTGVARDTLGQYSGGRIADRFDPRLGYLVFLSHAPVWICLPGISNLPWICDC